MGKVVKLSAKVAPKFPLKRAQSKKEDNHEKHGQLSIFQQPEGEGKVVNLSSNLSPFQEAMMFDEKDSAKAQDLYLKAIESGDNVSDSFCNLGILKFQQDQKPEAIDCFTKALKHEPRHFEAHYNLANLYLEVENLALAKVHYEVAAQLDPSYPDVYYNLGVVYGLDNDFDNAQKALEKYIEIAPEEEVLEAKELLLSMKLSTSR